MLANILSIRKTNSIMAHPDQKTSWGKRERYSFGYAVFLMTDW